MLLLELNKLNNFVILLPKINNFNIYNIFEKISKK